MTAGDTQAWEHVGRLLQERRVQMDTRYANLTWFCEERGIDYRLAWDLEKGARGNYRRATLTAAEIAYGLRPGSIEAALEGGALSPSAEAEGIRPVPVDAPAIIRDNWDDAAVRIVWQTALPRHVRLGMIGYHLGQPAGAEKKSPRSR